MSRMNPENKRLMKNKKAKEDRSFNKKKQDEADAAPVGVRVAKAAPPKPPKKK